MDKVKNKIVIQNSQRQTHSKLPDINTSGHPSSIISFIKAGTTFISDNVQALFEEMSPYFASMKKRSLVSVGASSSLVTSLNALTYTKLNFFDLIKFNKGPIFTVDQVNQEITILEDCSVKIYGEVSAEFGNTKQFNIGVTLNGNIGGTPKYAVGLGAGKPINLSSSTVLNLTSGDEISVSALSLDGDLDLTIISSSIQLEFVDIL